MTRRRIPVAVLGATGVVGQRFLSLLEGHPWFRVSELAASERSAGKPYREAVRWLQSTPIPEEVQGLPVKRVGDDLDASLVFSALSSDVAGPAEEELAGRGHLVVSNAKNHRMDPRVPLLIPEVNPEHLELLDRQPWGSGGIVTNPNCSTIGIALALKPLHDAFGVGALHVVTLQAVSGAGVPGVSSMEMVDNVIPFISGEEEKIEHETGKILGVLQAEGVTAAQLRVSAQCNRVPVLDGHLASVSVQLEATRGPSEAEVMEALSGFRGRPQELELPTAPRSPIVVLDGEADPQPRRHRDLGGGMSVSVGRLRPCPILGWRFVLLSHNTVRGAAGGAILCAELAAAEGRVPGAPDSWPSGS